MPGPFSIPPDAQARMSMLSKLHSGARSDYETGLRTVHNIEEIDVEPRVSAKHAAAHNLPADSYTDAQKSTR